MALSSLPQHSGRPHHSVAFNMAGIALIIGMIGLAIASGLAMLSGGSRPDTANAAPVTRTLVGKPLHIPADWLEDGSGSAQGFASRIDLQLDAPLGRDGGMLPVDVTLMPLSQARPSAGLLDGVYLHQFMPNELSGPPGLVGKPLYATEGYEDETVWYDALSQNPFVAKCANAPIGGQHARCIRTVALPGGIAAVYAFDFSALYAWRQFDQIMDQPLHRIGAL